MTRVLLFLAIGVLGYTIVVSNANMLRFTPVVYWLIISFCEISLLSGMLFFMHAVGLTHDGDCNVYAPGLRIFSGLQIVLFVAALAILCVNSRNQVGQNHPEITRIESTVSPPLK